MRPLFRPGMAMDALGQRFVHAMGLNPLCGSRMRLGHVVHHAFELCDTHMATRPLVVSAAAQLLGLLHRPNALLESPSQVSPCAPLAWRLQHARLVELKKADARIQVLAVVLVGIVGMARESDGDYVGVEFAERILQVAHGGTVPPELRSVLRPPQESARVLAYDRDVYWHHGDAVDDNDRMLTSARHARPVWSSYFQTAFHGLERQDLQHGGHLRWAEPDAVARGGAPPDAYKQAQAQKAALAGQLGLLAHQFAALETDARDACNSPKAAQRAYDAVHCRERFRPLPHDHPGFWTPRAGYMMTPMWHDHFPDEALLGFRTRARDCCGAMATAAAWDSSAAGLAPGDSRPACPRRTCPSERPGRGTRTQSARAVRFATCCLRRPRAQKGSGSKRTRGETSGYAVLKKQRKSK